MFAVNEALESKRLQYSVSKMRSEGLLPAGPPDLAKVVDRGPIHQVVQSLGTMTGDPRWH